MDLPRPLRFKIFGRFGLGLLICVGLGLQALPVDAKCAYRNTRVWPGAGSIPTNPVFMIQGFGADQEWVRGLKACDLKLVSTAGESVCLLGVVGYEGEFHLRQVLLQPVRELTPGATYRLQWPESLDKAATQWLEYEPGPAPLGKRTWTVDRDADLVAPQWQRPAEVTGTEHVGLGCGPRIQATVLVDARDDVSDQDMLAKVTLRAAGTSERRQYLVPFSEGHLYVGHGMCSGAFRLEEGRAYEAQVELLDGAGNLSEPSDVLRFTMTRAPRSSL